MAQKYYTVIKRDIMNTINSTNAKQNFGSCLMSVAGGPILIEKSGNPAAVMLSYDEYNRLLDIENKMLLSEALEAASNGFLDNEESKDWFNEMNNRYLSVK